MIKTSTIFRSFLFYACWGGNLFATSFSAGGTYDCLSLPGSGVPKETYFASLRLPLQYSEGTNKCEEYHQEFKTKVRALFANTEHLYWQGFSDCEYMEGRYFQGRVVLEPWTEQGLAEVRTLIEAGKITKLNDVPLLFGPIPTVNTLKRINVWKKNGAGSSYEVSIDQFGHLLELVRTTCGEKTILQDSSFDGTHRLLKSIMKESEFNEVFSNLSEAKEISIDRRIDFLSNLRIEMKLMATRECTELPCKPN